jgi:hypothetical protein
MYRFILTLGITTIIVATGLVRADSVMTVDKGYAAEAIRWNRFADILYALHKKRIDGKDLDIKEKSGGYFRYENFYKEQKFYDKKSGRLLSLIQWETKNPKNIHVIQVFFYDDQGRMTRDFAAVYRIEDHDDPMVTEINLHAYPKGLHAFRQFNASDEIVYEHCLGKWQGRHVKISLGVLELEEFRDEPNTIMTSPEYKQCFAGIPMTAGKYLTPQ